MNACQILAQLKCRIYIRLHFIHLLGASVSRLLCSHVLLINLTKPDYDFTAVSRSDLSALLICPFCLYPFQT